MICFDDPVLVLFSQPAEDKQVSLSRFIPAWRLKRGVIQLKYLKKTCIDVDSFAIIRTGRGWGRRSESEYYLVTGDSVVKLKKKPTRRLNGEGWMDCLYNGDSMIACVYLEIGSENEWGRRGYRDRKQYEHYDRGYSRGYYRRRYNYNR